MVTPTTAQAHPRIYATYAAFTQQDFLLREVTMTAEQLQAGISTDVLKRSVIDDDLFQLASPASRRSTLTVTRRRLTGTTPTLLDFLADGSLDLRRLTNLYLILLQHRLLREFVAEVLLEAVRTFSYRLTPSDLNTFIHVKASQMPEVAAWSPATRAKARSRLISLSQAGGLLTTATPGWRVELQDVPRALREELTLAGRQSFLPLLLDHEVL